MRKIIYMAVLAFVVDVHAQTFIERKFPAEGALKRVNPQINVDEITRVNAQKECFNELITNVIKSKIPPENAIFNESEIVMRSVLDERNVLKQDIFIDPAKNGYSEKRYVVASLPGIANVEQTYYIMGKVKFELEYLQDTLVQESFMKMKCWIDRNIISQDLGTKEVELKLIEDGEGFSYDFEGEIDVRFYKSITLPEIIVRNDQRLLETPKKSGEETEYFMKVPESFWIDDQYENQYSIISEESFRLSQVKVGGFYLGLDIRELATMKAISLNSSGLPTLSEFSFDNADHKISFYF